MLIPDASNIKIRPCRVCRAAGGCSDRAKPPADNTLDLRRDPRVPCPRRSACSDWRSWRSPQLWADRRPRHRPDGVGGVDATWCGRPPAPTTTRRCRRVAVLVRHPPTAPSSDGLAAGPAGRAHRRGVLPNEDAARGPAHRQAHPTLDLRHSGISLRVDSDQRYFMKVDAGSNSFFCSRSSVWVVFPTVSQACW